MTDSTSSGLFLGHRVSKFEFIIHRELEFIYNEETLAESQLANHPLWQLIIASYKLHHYIVTVNK